MGSEFGIFEGFGWVHCLVLVDETGFGRVQSSVFLDLGIGLAHFWQTGLKFGLFAGVQMGMKFGFGGQTWV